MHDGTGHYFGGPLPAWHGSLCATDMTIPIIFSFPNGRDEALSRFEWILGLYLPHPPAEIRITDIRPTAIELFARPEDVP